MLTQPSVDCTVPFADMARDQTGKTYFFKGGNIAGAGINNKAAH
jgi:hypothetical protein